jgi:selenocysteine lyase/cysteine desulfurase
MDRIARHACGATGALLDRLAGLGSRVTIYGPTGTAGRGGTVAFNIRSKGGGVPCQ